MYKFHQIPTDKFIPISHENSYLFNHYEKISNFLQFDFDVIYKNILAKPVKNEGTFDFYSVFENLSSLPENQPNDPVLIQYWKFIDSINIKINNLEKSNNENNRNWASLLAKTFNHKDNYIFTDGTNFCIVWGWAFNNNYERPIEKSVELPIENNDNIQLIKDIDSSNTSESITEIVNKVEEKKNDQEVVLENDSLKNNETVENDFTEDSNFIKFLKWIASKFWWLLWLFLLIIIILFFLKSCEQDKVYNDMNSKLIKLEQKANNCCN